MLPGSEMASGVAAVRGRDGEAVIIVDVAGRAGHVGVALGQQKAGHTVIKSGSGPTYGVVAIGAISGGERGPGRRVNGIVGLLPGGEVATGIAAIRWGDVEVVIVVDVTRSARNIGVAVG